jgi:hypothetical protein
MKNLQHMQAQRRREEAKDTHMIKKENSLLFAIKLTAKQSG